MVADVAEKIGLAKSDAAEAKSKNGLYHLYRQCCQGELFAQTSGRKELKLGPGGRNGISSDMRGFLGLKWRDCR